MKSLSDLEKRQLGFIIHHFRTMLHRSGRQDRGQYNQVNFAKGICSQTQLSRLENGEVLKDGIVYYELLSKLNLKYEKVAQREITHFEQYIQGILDFQNNSKLIINPKNIFLMSLHFQNVFKNNIILSVYNEALEFIAHILNEDYQEAGHLVNDMEGLLEIFSDQLLVLILHYLGKYYTGIYRYQTAIKYYLLSIENMQKYGIDNPIIYYDLAMNYFLNNKNLKAIGYLRLAFQAYIDTDYDLILEKIYWLYALIYLKQGYFEESLENLFLARNVVAKRKTSDLTINHLLLEASIYYLQGKIDLALNISDQINQISNTDYVHVFQFIFSQDKKVPELTNKNLKLIIEFYMHENRVYYYDNILKYHLERIPLLLRLIILADYYRYLKETNRYKKALELGESLRIFL